MSDFYEISALILLVGLVLLAFYYKKKPESYNDNLKFIRKAYYVGCVLFFLIGFYVKDIKMTDWKLLIGIGIFFLLIDILILQTLDITKLGKAEFQNGDGIRFHSLIKEGQDLLNNYNSKQTEFTRIISETVDHLDNLGIAENWEDYKNNLETYLEKYTDTFEFELCIRPVIDLSNTVELSNALKSIEYFFNEPILNEEWRNETLNRINAEYITPLIKNKPETEKSKRKQNGMSNDEIGFIISFAGNNFSYLIGVRSNPKKSHKVDVVDARFIFNMAQIYDWFRG